MAEPEYEYRMWAIPMERILAPEQLSFENLGIAVLQNIGFGKFQSARNDIEGGDWEVVSHSHIAIGGRTLTTYIVRRPRR